MNQTSALGLESVVTRAPPVEKWNLLQTVGIIVISSFLSLLTIAGNMLVMLSLKMDRQLRTISNYFLLSLSMADFLIGLISMPLYTMYLLLGYWPLGSLVCDCWLAFDYLNSNASVLNLLLISFDRYFSVTRPLTYRVRRTTRRAAALIALTWLLSALLWPPWIFLWPYIEGQRTVPPDDCYIQFLQSNAYITFGTAIAAFYLPVTVMIILYWRIWQETQKRYKDLTTLFLVSTGGALKSIRGKTDAPANLSSSASSSMAAAPGMVCLTRNNTFSSSEEPSTQSAPFANSESIYTILIQLQKNNSNAEATIKMIDPEVRPSLTAGNKRHISSINRLRHRCTGAIYGENNSTLPEKIPEEERLTKPEDEIACNIHPPISEKESLGIENGEKQPSDADDNNGNVPLSAGATYTPQQPKSERKAAKTLSAILLAFIVTWTPYNVVALLRSLLAQDQASGDADVIPKPLWLFFYYLCYINSTVNPLCYALCNASFRRTYVRILKCKWTKRKHKAASSRFHLKQRAASRER